VYVREEELGVCRRGPTRNDYEASGEFGVRTEEPKGGRWIGEDGLPGIRGGWRQGEEILRDWNIKKERCVKGECFFYACSRTVFTPLAR